MTRPATPASTRQRVVVLTFASAAEAEQFDAAWERFDPSVQAVRFGHLRAGVDVGDTTTLAESWELTR